MTKLTVLTTEDKLAEIRRVYFSTTKQTIGDDLARAVQLLKSMNTEEERERARVYMDGLAQMRSDWARQGKGGGGTSRGGKKPGAPGGAPQSARPGDKGRRRGRGR